MSSLLSQTLHAVSVSSREQVKTEAGVGAGVGAGVPTRQTRRREHGGAGLIFNRLVDADCSGACQRRRAHQQAGAGAGSSFKRCNACCLTCELVGRVRILFLTGMLSRYVMARPRRVSAEAWSDCRSHSEARTRRWQLNELEIERERSLEGAHQ